MSKKNILAVLIAICIGTSASSTEISFGFKSIAALSRQDLLIDGVSTKYALGGTGLIVGSKFTDKFAVSAMYLRSYYPKYSTTYNGTRLSGDVSGYFTEISANYQLLQYKGLRLNLTASIGEGEQGSQSMSGMRANKPVSATTESKIEKTDLSLVASYYSSKGGIFGLGLGIANWTINAQGVAFIEVDDDFATDKKNVRASNTDPFYDFTYTKEGANFNWQIGYRLSKLTSEVITEADQVSFNINFKF